MTTLLTLNRVKDEHSRFLANLNEQHAKFVSDKENEHAASIRKLTDREAELNRAHAADRN